MSNERPVRVPPDALENQRLAADPRANAWVSANAGSGKTFILSRRVIRLLLEGATPQSILCLTYTKAAAAEMRHRVSEILGKWALLDDDALGAEIADMTGAPAQAALLARARQLFALALETPGGLKINTIHAFCESVLQRFPLEAGVPVNFTVIEDADREAMIADAREGVLAAGLDPANPLHQAVSLLFERLSDHQIETAIAHALKAGRKLEPVLAAPETAKANLHAALGISEATSLHSFSQAALASRLVSTADQIEILRLSPPKRGKRAAFEDKLERVNFESASFEAWTTVFLTAGGTVPKIGFPSAALRKADQALAERVLREAERLEALQDRYRSLAILEHSAALLDVLVAMIGRYEAAKRQRSLLDFDDLVVRTAALFANPDFGDWVRYKLDAGIDHILVDESQDTNPEQWQVVKALTEDFFAGESAARRPRTVFAVGDPKQSIYSFQGAEPELFLDMGRDLGRRARQIDAVWHARELRTSFRTLGNILDGVDLVATRTEVAPALFAPESGIRHESARTHKGGAIDIWPTIAKTPDPGPGEDWPLEPIENLASAPRQLARTIARTIRHWIDTRAPLGPRGRAIRPEDVLVLVQRRSPVFGEIVRALKDAGVDSPGADRLPISAHIAIDDLLGLADILLNPGDDLMLAAILRSPLYDFSEEALFALAQPRAEGERLWSALRRSSDPQARAAFAELSELRQRLDLDRPYGFFAHVLYALGGLKRLHARLGAEVDEVIAEFLDLALAHEQTDQPSLTGFLAAMRKSAIVIKRDLVSKASGVRVMTVHGAKGLEAPVVILADAATGSRSDDTRVFIGPADAPFLVYSPNAASDCRASATLREAGKDRRKAEYWRNLYVAMTRAEDHLVVAGTTNEKDSTEGTWYAAINAALAPEGEAIEDPASGQAIIRYPSGAPAPAAVTGEAQEVRTSDKPLNLGPVAPRRLIRTLSPSLMDAYPEGDVVEDGFDTLAERLVDARTAKARGIAIHALLQHLTNVPHELRAEVGLQAATTLLPDAPELAAPVSAEAMAILVNPDLAHVFGPDSRAEVSFALGGARNGEPISLTGRIDRLVVKKDRVQIIDFKSDAAVPATPAEVPRSYCLQLGLYARAARRLFPDHRIEAAILWTRAPLLMVLDENAIMSVSDTITLG